MVHESAAVGFARSADAYERARPEYPDGAMAWLAGRLGLRRGVTVLDLAAGTGKLTRRLLETGATVVAVEPVAEMRAGLSADATVLDGVAEAIPLGDATADAVTVGQAFHWFDGDRALREIHRVLRPRGNLALVWNRRELDDPVQAAIQALLAPYRYGTPAHASDAWRGCLPAHAVLPCAARNGSSPSSSASTRTGWPTASARRASSPRRPAPSARPCSNGRERSPRAARSRCPTAARSGPPSGRWPPPRLVRR